MRSAFYTTGIPSIDYNFISVASCSERGGIWMNLIEALTHRVSRQPGGKFLTYLGEAYDYNVTNDEFNERVNRFANALKKLGTNRGDVVAVLAGLRPGISPYIVENFFACGKIGAIAFHVNVRLNANEWLQLLGQVKPKIIILEEPYLEGIESIKRNLDWVERFVFAAFRGKETPGGMEGYEDLIHSNSGHNPPYIKIEDDDIVDLICTGGTTGIPKAVCQTHKGWVCSSFAQQILYGGVLGKYSIHLPLYHVAAMAEMITGVMTGSPIEMFETPKGVTPQSRLKYYEEFRVEGSSIFPSTLKAMVPFLKSNKYDLNSMKAIYASGEVLDEETVVAALEVLPRNILFSESYGCAEMHNMAISIEKNRALLGSPKELRKRLRSCGRPVLNEARIIIDRSGREAEVGQVGELAFKGPQVARGYWNMPEEKQRDFKNGWWFSGDLAKIDEDGYVYIMGRIKDMIKSGGENIYPIEIEEVISKHKAVKSVAVIGVPHSKWGQTPKAIVVLKDRMKVSEEEIIEFCKKYLASYKKPTSVEFVKELPQTHYGQIGKIDKKKLQELYGVSQSYIGEEMHSGRVNLDILDKEG
jgi:acyl-CoA synthetase (AMP-forming)/AMP-acid ligase II